MTAQERTTPPYRTVLADDAVSLRKLIRLTLERSGSFIVVGEAEHGAHATRLAEELQPDLVLLDVSMPVQDGMEALPEILKVAPNTKVVMLSGFEAQRLAPAALDLGASGYLEKGAHPTRFVDDLLGIMDASPGLPTHPLHTAKNVIPPEELMSFVAHELRSPVTLVQGFGSALMSQWESLNESDRLEAIARMTEGARRLETVLNNMLYLRAAESGSLSVHMALEAGDALVRSLAVELENLSVDHSFEVDMGGDLPSVKADITRLQQVLTNLVVNAAKFSPTGSPIVLRARNRDGDLLIQVLDRGPGIPAEMRDSLFEKFARGTATSPGVGLGLFISRKLMESMGGDIWIDDGDGGAGIAVSCLLPGESWTSSRSADGAGEKDDPRVLPA